MKNSKIEWTDHTWNPWVGCAKVSDGCANCYAQRNMERFGQDFNTLRRTKDATFYSPISWMFNARVFTCSWSDFFIEDADEWRADAWKVIKDTPHLDYLILTKRPERIGACLPDYWDEIRGHIWLGVSVENKKVLNRIRIMTQGFSPPRDFPPKRPAIFFVSAEPLLGKLDLTAEMRDGLIDWLIVGGESGPRPRYPKPEQVIALRDQAIEYKIPFFFKQWGGQRKDPDGSWGGHYLEGKVWQEMPEIG